MSESSSSPARSAASVWLEVCRLAGSERVRFVEAACAGDRDLRAEVEALIGLGEAIESIAPPDARGAPTEPGDRIGQYRMLSLLGSGASADIYLAEQENPRRRVALKILRARADDEAERARFEGEAEALSRCEHPGIPRLIEAGEFPAPLGARPFFSMEAVEGRDILEHARRQRLSLRRRLVLFALVCDAVHHAHQKGVIHRDLKPANILVDSEGRPKLLDFGAALPLSAGRGARFPEWTGTIAYMSPEQAAGDDARGGLDVRSDIYALGVILYELLSGRLPHPEIRGLPLPEAVRLLRDGAPVPLRRASRFIPRDLELVVAKALSTEKERRYVSAAELASDLRRFLSGEPVIARKASALYVCARFATRHKAVSAACAVALLSLVGGFGAALRSAIVAERRLEEAARFSDALELRDLLVESRHLWPRRPEKLADFDAWLARADGLVERLELHEASLESVTREIEAAGPRGASPFERFRRETFAALVDGIRALAPIAKEVRARRSVAAEIAERTVVEHRAEWTAAAEWIAIDPRFDGLRLEPIVGLVPLGMDPESHLWEFWLWESGARPEREASPGPWRVTGETGIVLVLVPGGRFVMGATRDPAGPNFYLEATPDEGPPCEVELAPYLISKYEMSQGQWLRIAGANPSFHGETEPDRLALPVESVSHDECAVVLPRLGLNLPSEAQWERAARGGTCTPWWTGDDPTALETAENTTVYWSGTRPGPARMTPVGSFRPNPFGLCDVLGNAREHTSHRDGISIEPTDSSPSSANPRMTPYRTGSFASEPFYARAAKRMRMLSTSREGETGVRPAMNLPER